MSAQPEALRLADWMETFNYPKMEESAAELRRLYAEVDRLSYRLAYPDNFAREWVGLTDEDKLMCWARATHDADVEHKTEHQCLMDYGTEIEAKLRSKNNG
jgi:hypothetical protein